MLIIIAIIVTVNDMYMYKKIAFERYLHVYKDVIKTYLKMFHYDSLLFKIRYGLYDTVKCKNLAVFRRGDNTC